jgi:hypothetical protein
MGRITSCNFGVFLIWGGGGGRHSDGVILCIENSYQKKKITSIITYMINFKGKQCTHMHNTVLNNSEK